MGGREAGPYPKRLWQFWEAGSHWLFPGSPWTLQAPSVHEKVGLAYGFPTFLAPEPL